MHDVEYSQDAQFSKFASSARRFSNGDDEDKSSVEYQRCPLLEPCFRYTVGLALEEWFCGHVRGASRSVW